MLYYGYRKGINFESKFFEWLADFVIAFIDTVLFTLVEKLFLKGAKQYETLHYQADCLSLSLFSVPAMFFFGGGQYYNT